MTTHTDSKVIVALDYAQAKDALHLVNQLDPSLCKLKVGKELFTAGGPQLVEQLVAKKFKVFLDLKFHDIPNTVAKACTAACNLGVWMLNVHASGGIPMMEAALAGVKAASVSEKPQLIAVTVLTSMNQTTLAEVGIETSIEQHVLCLAQLTKRAGLNGVVCSALEARLIRQSINDDFTLVTPGIRTLNASKDDQTRIVTPSQGLAMGADYLVIGRPITQAKQPLAALEEILEEISAS